MNIKKRKVKTKTDLMYHSQNRFLLRYEQDLSQEQLCRWNKDIINKNENVVFLGKQSLTRQLFLIEDKYYAVFNCKLKSICTFLTKEMMDCQLEEIHENCLELE